MVIHVCLRHDRLVAQVCRLPPFSFKEEAVLSFAARNAGCVGSGGNYVIDRDKLLIDRSVLSVVVDIQVTPVTRFPIRFWFSYSRIAIDWTDVTTNHNLDEMDYMPPTYI